jgi:hypothetical protein
MLEKYYMYWFTSTPFDSLTPVTRKNDDVLLKHKEQFEKGTLISIFKKRSGKSFEFVMHSANHFGLREPYQLTCSKMLVKHINEMINFYRFNDGVNMVKCNIMGDFNTFPDLKGRTIAPIIEDDVLPFEQHIDPNVDYTFVGYPYDLGLVDHKILTTTIESIKNLGPEEARQIFVDKVLEMYDGPIISYLDQVFTRCIWDSKVRVHDFGIDKNNLKEIFKSQGITGYPMIPSDHFPVILEYNI